MAEKKSKSKEQQLAEIAFAAGRATMFESDDDVDLLLGPKIALAKWKEQCETKKHGPRSIELAHRQWVANGSPKEGIFTGPAGGLGWKWYVFAPNGDYLLAETLEKNFKA